MHEENKLRAERIACAATAVQAYNDNQDDPEAMAADFLADLRHFCDLHSLDFGKVDQRGRAAYVDEIGAPA